MNIDRAAVEVADVEHPAKRRHITELRFAGWTVHVDQATVTVPQQDLAGKAIQDLAYCLHKAYVLAQVRLSSRPAVLEPAQVAITDLHTASRPTHRRVTVVGQLARRLPLHPRRAGRHRHGGCLRGVNPGAARRAATTHHVDRVQRPG